MLKKYIILSARYYSCNSLEDYFGVECKRVSSTEPDRYLATDYIKKGVMRFIDGTYSIGHNYAAMLGFVIDDKVTECINLICERMKKYKKEICMREDWVDETDFGAIQKIYRTRHVQHGQKVLITLLHLFLIIN